MKSRTSILIGALTLGAVGAQAAFPIYPELPLKYPHTANWDSHLPGVWEGWKSRFLSGGNVQGNDPSGTKKVISEGQSYGMLLSVWFGDQGTFNSIWSATEGRFWHGNWYGWEDGDNNFAGDADIDICGALIFASAMVDAGKWPDYTEPNSGKDYKAKAKQVLQSIISNFIDVNNDYRINSWPGAGDGIRNPSYHMPGWYPIFKEFGAANGIGGMDWDKAASGAFDLIEAQPNHQAGMARNFSNGSGGSPSGGTSSPNNYDMGFDAIRVPYRMAIAADWYPPGRTGKTALQRAVNWGTSVWATGKVNPASPGEYQVSDASLMAWGQGQYEAFMTRFLWGALAVAVKDQSAQSAAAATTITSYLTSSVSGNNFLSSENPDTVTSAANPMPSLRNYYAQSLGLLGALVVCGRAWNIWDDLKNPWVPKDTGATFTAPLTATPATINLAKQGSAITADQVSKITATLSKAVPWHLYLKGKTTGATMDTAGNTASVSFTWNSTRKGVFSGAFGVENVDVRLVYGGVDSVTSTSSKATITLQASAGIIERTVSGNGAVRWSESGLLLQDPALKAGDLVEARVYGLDGRANTTSQTQLREGSGGVLLEIPVQHSLKTRVLELTDINAQARFRFVLSPNP